MQSLGMEYLQDKYAPESYCFGCGPRNVNGLRIKSFLDGSKVVTEFKPERYHVAFGNYLNGGIIATVFDCNGNWAAAYSLMRRKKAEVLPSTVTYKISVKYLMPVSIDERILFVSYANRISGNRVYVSGYLEASKKIKSEMRGVYVSVGREHPAFNRWSGVSVNKEKQSKHEDNHKVEE